MAGKSVVFCPDSARAIEGVSITSDKARTSAIVPILVDGDYVGVIGFDDWQRVREFDSSIVSALEIAAGLVGAALHRQRLVDTMRRERELRRRRAIVVRDARQCAAAHESDQAGARCRPARLRQQHPHRRHAPARRRGGLSPSASTRPPISGRRSSTSRAARWSRRPTRPRPRPRRPAWARCSRCSPNRPSTRCSRSTASSGRAPPTWHEREGHKSVYLLPVVVGEQTVGCIGLVFLQDEALSAERAELALAVAHQITLVHRPQETRHGRQGRGRARRAQSHRPGNPRRPRAGLHGHPDAARRRRRSHARVRAQLSAAGHPHPHPRISPARASPMRAAR